jgi:class 3 adenylate cyclase
MSRETDKLTTVRRIVLFFDICSSTAILEDLLRTENEALWKNLLIGVKKFLHQQSSAAAFTIYKFLGDGWILLFDPTSIKGADLMKFLHDLSSLYEALFNRNISPVLAAEYSVGITFGIDCGSLSKIIMTNQEEYIGRALNVAARLQAAIKQKDGAPAGKLLISTNAFTALGLNSIPKYAGKTVTRTLANVAGGERYRVRKIVIRAN